MESTASGRMTPRLKKILIAVVVFVVVPAALFVALYRPYPPDKTPEGAYMRIARSVANDDPQGFFAYLETDAQWASYTIRDMRKAARLRIEESYPEPQRTQLVEQYRRFAEAPDGADVFALMYRERGWAKRLRKDLSGAVKIDIEGDRASLVTARGTRWPFRKRDNGIWGITIFTAELVAEAEKATRDLAVVNAAADDYDRVRHK